MHARALIRLAEDHDWRSVASAIKGTGSANSFSRLHEFVAEFAQTGQVPPEVRLADAAYRTKITYDSDRLRNFFAVHEAAIRTEGAIGDSQIAGDYLDRLDSSAKAPGEWTTVEGDPAALAILPVLKSDPKLLSFYQRNREWLPAVLLQFDTLPEDGTSRLDAVRQILQTALKYDPLPRQAVEENHLGSIGFGLFLSHGRLIQEAVKEGLPLDETLEIIYANPDHVASAAEGTSPSQQKITEVAADLAQVSPDQINVWKYARINPLALRLNQAAPGVADQVLGRYGDHDITGLLFTFYDSEKSIDASSQSTNRWPDVSLTLTSGILDEPWLLEPMVG